jgi:hypothetical protein
MTNHRMEAAGEIAGFVKIRQGAERGKTVWVTEHS